MDRKALLLNSSESAKLTKEEELKLREAETTGSMYLALVNSPGWKDLMQRHINRQISQERYLEAESTELADIRSAQKELFDLLRFVNKRVEDGQKAFEKLHDSK